MAECYERRLIALIVAGCVLFNFVLCLLNTHAMRVTDSAVIGVELLLMAAAWGVLLWGGKRLQVGWLLLALACVLIPVVVMLLREQPMPKTVRDILIIPTFVLLGLRYGRHDVSGFVIGICVLVLGIALLEVTFVTQYEQFVDIIQYFISKGATPEEQATFNGTRLFVSAIRMDGRMLGGFFGDMRASSVFLEPVSLGMFAAIVAFYALAAGEAVSPGRRIVLLAFALLFLALCDGRLALGLVILGIAARLLLSRLPKIVLFLYLPMAIAFALLLPVLLSYTPQGDNLLGRIGTTAMLLSSMPIDVYLGLSDSVLSTVDSGIAYLIERLGLIGVAIFWCALCTLSRYEDPAQRAFAHMACLYLSVSWLVSAASFTIKTAAMFWFLYGTFQAARMTLAPGRNAAEVQPALQPFEPYRTVENAR